MIRFTLSLLGLIFLLASHAIAATTLNRVVAIVNDDIITELELENQLKTVQRQLRGQQTRLPPEDVLKRQVLEREILKQVQLQLARATGIRVDDGDLNNTLNRIAEQNNMSLREFRSVLERDGFEFSQFRNEMRSEMILARLRQREVHNRITISDQEVENFLATQAAQGNINDEYNLSHILVSVPETANAEAIQRIRSKASKILERLNSGEEFDQVAISESDGQKALEGGNLGWRQAGQLPTIFSTLVINMQVGQHSDLIRSSSGFHIIKLNDKRSGEKHMLTQTHARHILIRSNELNTETEILSRLRQLKSRIEAGDDFTELAKSHSEDRGSAANGGDLGWVSPGQMVPQFEAAMNALNPKQVSEPFQSEFGWHIVQVLERRDVDNSDEFNRNKAREFIRQRKIEESTEAWIRQIREEAFVEIKVNE